MGSKKILRESALAEISDGSDQIEKQAAPAAEVVEASLTKARKKAAACCACMALGRDEGGAGNAKYWIEMLRELYERGLCLSAPSSAERT